MREAVRRSLEVRDFEAVGEAINGEQAVEQVKELRPDVIVLDLSMPVMSGFDAARHIIANRPESRVVILSNYPDKSFVEEAKRIGIRGYISKTRAGEALVNAIDAIVKSQDFIDAS